MSVSPRRAPAPLRFLGPVLLAWLSALLLLQGACRPIDAGGKQVEWAAISAEELRALYAGSPSTWPAPEVDPGVEWREFDLPPQPQHPPHNPHSRAKEELGRLLFFDGRLSGTGQMACASCHVAELGWGDGRTVSFGHEMKPLTRNTPSIQNSGHFEQLFWDGRASGLEDLVQRVFHSAMEMRVDEERMVAGLRTSVEYRRRFAETFGDEEPSVTRVAKAIACFVRTVNSDGSSAFDRFLAGDRKALSDEALHGLHLFRTRGRCMNCHHGPLLSDGGFHDVGLSYYGRKYEDLGRYLITGDPADVGRFKTPSLRNVSRTGPYMHNGLFDLPGILNMYSAGMPDLEPAPDRADDPLFPRKSPHLVPLDLSPAEQVALLAFLESLTEWRRRVRVDLPGWGDWTRERAACSQESR